MRKTKILAALLMVCMFCAMFTFSAGATADSALSGNAVMEYDGIYKLKNYTTGAYLSYKNGSVGSYIPGVGTSSEINQLWRVTYFMTVGGDQVWYTIRPMANLDVILSFNYLQQIVFRDQPTDTPGLISDTDMWMITKQSNGRYYIQSRVYKVVGNDPSYGYLHMNSNFNVVGRFYDPSEWVLTKID